MAELDDGLEEREEDQPSGGRRTAGGFAAGLAIGVLLGAGIALLYAPNRGSRTRDALRRRLQRLREDASDELERAGRGTRRELRRRRRQLEDRLEQARERLE